MNIAFLSRPNTTARQLSRLMQVCRDYFSNMTTVQFARKPATGEIDLPIVRIEESQKAARSIDLLDPAARFDKRREAAKKRMITLREDSEQRSRKNVPNDVTSYPLELVATRPC